MHDTSTTIVVHMNSGVKGTFSPFYKQAPGYSKRTDHASKAFKAMDINSFE
jgi:hypothetical protein